MKWEKFKMSTQIRIGDVERGQSIRLPESEGRVICITDVQPSRKRRGHYKVLGQYNDGIYAERTLHGSQTVTVVGRE